MFIASLRNMLKNLDYSNVNQVNPNENHSSNLSNIWFCFCQLIIFVFLTTTCNKQIVLLRASV